MRRSTLSALVATPAIAVSMAGLALSPTAVATVPAPGPEATAVADFQAPDDGIDRSTVYVVTAAADRAAATEGVHTVAARDAASGERLAIARTTVDRIPALQERLQDAAAPGERAPGFRSFPTLEAAQRAIEDDRSVQASAQTLELPPIDNGATVTPWLDQVQESAIRQSISDLSTTWPNRYFSSSHGPKAAAYLHDAWTQIAAGRSDVTVAYDDSCTDCASQKNVTMTVKGTENPDEIVVIGAHFDSISDTGEGDAMDAPGADDNASATATVTEVARVALASGWKPKRTVVFAGYAAEEVGLVGSDAMASSYAQQGKNVVGVLNMDMTNYDGGSTDMALMQDNVNGSLNTFNEQVFDTYLAPRGLTRGTLECGYGCSDHASWTAAGFPASMMSESELFPQLHTPGDTLENSGGDASHSVKFAQFGLAFLGELAKTGA